VDRAAREPDISYTALGERLPSHAGERLSDASYRHAELSLDQLGVEPEHVMAQAPERRIAPSIGSLPPGLRGADRAPRNPR